jgi:hypothetical protein
MYADQSGFAAAQCGKALLFRVGTLTLPEAEPQEIQGRENERKVIGIPHCAAASRSSTLPTILHRCN